MEDSYAVAALARVLSAVIDSSGEFAVRLEFGRDAANHAVIGGHLVGTVTLQCQRCLEPMAVKLEIRPHLGLCSSEAEAERLPEELEPLIVGDAPLSIRKLVEDEILLALPIVARHARSCREVPAADSEAPTRGARQPFRDLRKLLDKGD
ncbi:MAG: YceD family protein [Gammaproteobacteria bacterium]|nr:YceD family protein [Gammaproteobacteria bacterium]